jgi:conjugal transfer mating pair stabilization protein TraN
VENFCTREATLKDNATTQKVNRTYQQVVTLNLPEYPAMEWQPDDPDTGRLLKRVGDGEPLVIPGLKNAIPKEGAG